MGASWAWRGGKGGVGAVRARRAQHGHARGARVGGWAGGAAGEAPNTASIGNVDGAASVYSHSLRRCKLGGCPKAIQGVWEGTSPASDGCNEALRCYHSQADIISYQKVTIGHKRKVFRA